MLSKLILFVLALTTVGCFYLQTQQTIDLENKEGKGGTGPNFEPSPFGGANPRAFKV